MNRKIKRSRVSRFIAFCLAVVMILSPLYSYSGLENGTKAAGEIKIISFKAEKYLSLGNKELKKIEGETEVHTGSEASPDYYGIEINSTEETIYYYNEGDTVFDFSKVTIDSLKLEGDNNPIDKSKYDIDFKISVYKPGASIPTVISSSDINNNKARFEIGLSTIINTEEISNGNAIIALYAMPEFDDNDLENYETTYTLQKTFNIENKSPLDDVALYNSDGSKYSENSWSKSATIKTNVEEKNYVGKIKYCYEEYEEGNKESPDNWTDIPALTRNGHFNGYVAYFDDNNNIVDSECVGDIYIDSTAPDIKSVIIEEREGNNNWATVSTVYKDTDDSYKIDYNPIRNASAVYRVSVTASDKGGSHIKGIKIDSKDNIVDSSKELDEYTATYDLVNRGADSTIQVIVTDKAENETKMKLTIVEDTTNPTIKELLVLDPNNVNPNEEVYISESVYSDNYIGNPTIKANMEGDLIKEVNIKVKRENGPEYVHTYTSGDGQVLFELGDCISGEYTSGVYTVTVSVKDNAGNLSEAENITLKVDVEAPKIDDTKTVFEYCSTNGGPWKEVSANQIENDCFMVNSDFKYRYVIYVEDDNTDVEEICVTSGVKEENNPPNYNTVTYNSEEKCYEIYIDNTKLNKDSTVQCNLKLIDGLENEIEYNNFGYFLKLANMDLEISSNFKLIDNDRKEFPRDSLPQHISKGYNLEIIAYSVYKIDKAGLHKNNENISSYNAILECSEKPDPSTGRYKATITFEIPSNCNKNESFKDCEVKVGDAHNRETEKTLGTMMYDQTRPRLVFEEGNVPETKWYSKYQLIGSISSGNDDEVESGFKSAQYSIVKSPNEELNTINGLDYNEENPKIEFAFDVPESETIDGTIITFDACDMADNKIFDENNANVVCVKVDKTNPKIDNFTISGTGYNNKSAIQIVSGTPKINATVMDNLTIGSVKIYIKYPDMEEDEEPKYVELHKENKKQVGVNINEKYNYEIKPLEGKSKLSDGKYTVNIIATDKAGNKIDSSKTFTLDNTKPVVSAEVFSGTESGKTSAGGHKYFKSDVRVKLSCKDENFDSNTVVVTNNNTPVSLRWEDGENETEHVAYVNIESEGKQSFIINAVDEIGNAAEEKTLSFTKDTVSPKVSVLINGAIYYSDGMGALEFTGDTNVNVSVSDDNVDNKDIRYKMIKSVPDKPKINTDYTYIENSKVFNFNDDAEYELEIVAKDMASNEGTKNVKFRIDKTPPELSISGISEGGTSVNASTVTLTMRELFWRDASGTATIYRKADDGSDETLLKTIDFNPTAFETSISESLSETGVYRIEFEASDRIGHTSTMSQTFTIDRDAPEIKLSGVKNYDLTNKSIDFLVEIKDAFFLNKSVKVTGTRTDINNKVSNISFSPFNQSGNPTLIKDTFSEDGIYDIEVSATDVAGNSHSEKVHFTIDKTAPVIGDLSVYDGTIIKEFEWNKDLDDLVTDLTVCDIHMYLNGSEYDGVSDIEDGSYLLLITAEDELGHYVEKSVSFVLDTKAPVIIVTGVEDDEVKNEMYTIDISLQLDEDTLQSVTLNGKAITITDNTASISVTEKGKYSLKMTASDEAGNMAEETITFRYGEVSYWWIWLIIAACVAAIGLIIVVVVKRRKEQ